MTASLVPLVVFVVGLFLFAISKLGAKTNRIGEILMLAGAIGFCLSGSHGFKIW